MPAISRGQKAVKHRRALCVCVLLVICTGCHAIRKSSPDAPASEYQTNPPTDTASNKEARRLNSHGARSYRNGNLVKAEELFRKSLEADINFGPAHNNLGQLYLDRHQLYLAAWEFEYASSLMPEHVEPVINQGLAYEMGERLNRAYEFYQLAYDQAPHHPAAIASLVRIRIKQDASTAEVAALLDELIMHDGRENWVRWAKELRATRYRSTCFACEGVCECDHNNPRADSVPAGTLPEELPAPAVSDSPSPVLIEPPLLFAPPLPATPDDLPRSLLVPSPTLDLSNSSSDPLSLFRSVRWGVGSSPPNSVERLPTRLPPPASGSVSQASYSSEPALASPPKSVHRFEIPSSH